jgi:hypothetical protein
MQPMQAAQIDPLKRTVKTSIETSIEKSSPEISTTDLAAPARQAQAKVIRQPKPPIAGPAVNQSDRALMR